MYRLILESLLGVTLELDKLYLRPCLPPDWKGFSMDYRYRTTIYKITVTVGSDKPGLTLDGAAQAGDALQMVDDQLPHTVELRILAEKPEASIPAAS
jgi:cellobiose phosphorylase